MEEGEGMERKRPQDWSAAEKLEVVIEAGKLDEESLGRYLREKGLHTANLQQWRQEVLEALEGKRRNGKNDPRDKRIRELERELKRKEAALAEAAALLVLKKKAHDIWGDHEDER
jgi:transposase-like protein